MAEQETVGQGRPARPHIPINQTGLAFGALPEFQEEGWGLPKSVGKLGKLLAATERNQAKGQVFLKGVIAKEQVKFEGLSLDTVRKPNWLAYTRQYVKARRPAGSPQEPESNPAKARRQEEAKWVMGAWDVSDEYTFLIAASPQPET